MTDNENTTLVDTSSIDQETNSLAMKILEETDPDKAKQLIALFNWNLSKKNTSRILKLNGLYDDVTEQMVTRFRTRSDQFTNSDLLDYMKAVQGAIDTSTKNLVQMEEPPTIVQQHNTQINVNVVDSFDRDAKERILAAVQAVMKNAQAAPVTEVPAEAVAETAIDELESVVDNSKETT